MHSNWTLFTSLCRILGGRDGSALPHAVEQDMIHQQVDTARQLGLLPALATRIEERPEIMLQAPEPESQLLQQALQDNTRDNMQAVMQAVKLARSLNKHGITPTFLKGTALLLTIHKERLGFRRQVDIDLVVAPAELRSACQALLDDGYAFYRLAATATGQPETYNDIEEAFKTSAAHHHLPPMYKPGYRLSVELHRHHLPARLQRRNPLPELINGAHLHKDHDAEFLTPSAEHQIIHIILGKMVHDGCLARREFPVREACDYIDLQEGLSGTIDEQRITRHCGDKYAIFSQLVAELTGYTNGNTPARKADIARRLKLMERRYNTPLVADMLNVHARATYLGQTMVHSPAKLPQYLKRLLSA